MKNSTVKVKAIKGQIFTQALNADGTAKLDKNGEAYGFIVVENPETIDLAFSYKNGGVKRGASAPVNMTVAAWEKAGRYYSEGMSIKGNVQIIESLIKQPGFQPKLAGENGVQLVVNGAPIYRGTKFDPTATLTDELLTHTNVLKTVKQDATAGA